MTNLKQAYETRVAQLKDHLDKSLEFIENDNILLAMKGNPQLDKFIEERIKEIFNNSIAAEKEITIQKLIEAFVVLKTERSKFENEAQRQFKMLEEMKYRGNELVDKLLEGENLLARKEKEISELKKKLSNSMGLIQHLETELKEKEKKLEFTTEANNNQLKELIKNFSSLKYNFNENYNNLENLKVEKSYNEESYKNIISNLKKENNELKGRLYELLKYIEEINNENNKLKIKGNVFDETHKLHQEQLQLNEERIKQETEERKKIESVYIKQNAKYKELLEKEKESHEVIMKELQEKKKKLRNEREEFKMALEEANKRSKELRKNLINKEDEIIILKMELATKIADGEQKAFKLHNKKCGSIEMLNSNMQSKTLVFILYC